MPTLDTEAVGTEIIHFTSVPSMMEAYENAVIKIVDKGNLVAHLILAHSRGLTKLKERCIGELKYSGHLIGESASRLKSYPDLMLEVITFGHSSKE